MWQARGDGDGQSGGVRLLGRDQSRSARPSKVGRAGERGRGKDRDRETRETKTERDRDRGGEKQKMKLC